MATKSSSRSKSTTKKSGSRGKRTTKKEQQTRKQMYAVLLFALGILIFCLAAVPGENVWLSIHQFQQLRQRDGFSLLLQGVPDKFRIQGTVKMTVQLDFGQRAGVHRGVGGGGQQRAGRLQRRLAGVVVAVIGHGDTLSFFIVGNFGAARSHCAGSGSGVTVMSTRLRLIKSSLPESSV